MKKCVEITHFRKYNKSWHRWKNLLCHCILCLTTDESSEHLFIWCQFASHLWNWIGDKLDCVINCSLVESFLSYRPVRCSSQVSDIYLAAVLHTLHSIWWARNSLCFQSVTTSLHSTKVCIHSLVAMFGNVSKGKCLS